MITSIQAAAGARRWCETTVAPPSALAPFLRAFPGTAVLCLHRQFTSVLDDGIAAYPHGLGSSPFWAFAGAHPGNTVATIGAYWAAGTEAMLDFERHNQSCMRVRYEDLITSQATAAERIRAFLHLGSEHQAVPSGADGADAAVPVLNHDAHQTLLQHLPAPAVERIRSLGIELGYESPDPPPAPYRRRALPSP
jgi:hypothetical protein